MCQYSLYINFLIPLRKWEEKKKEEEDGKKRLLNGLWKRGKIVDLLTRVFSDVTSDLVLGNYTERVPF